MAQNSILLTRKKREARENVIFLRSHSKYNGEARIKLPVLNIRHVFLFYRSMFPWVDTMNFNSYAALGYFYF